MLVYKVILFIASLLVMKQRDALIYIRCTNYTALQWKYIQCIRTTDVRETVPLKVMRCPPRRTF
jgi:hypothetical protein